jgi:hypothetical protein
MELQFLIPRAGMGSLELSRSDFLSGLRCPPLVGEITDHVRHFHVPRFGPVLGGQGAAAVNSRLKWVAIVERSRSTVPALKDPTTPSAWVRSPGI